jgi:hypothetical protein
LVVTVLVLFRGSGSDVGDWARPTALTSLSPLAATVPVTVKVKVRVWPGAMPAAYQAADACATSRDSASGFGRPGHRDRDIEVRALPDAFLLGPVRIRELLVGLRNADREGQRLRRRR